MVIVFRMATASSPSYPAEDWQTERGVLAANKYMLEHQIHTDVTFRLDDGNGKFENMMVSMMKLVLPTGVQVPVTAQIQNRNGVSRQFGLCLEWSF